MMKADYFKVSVRLISDDFFGVDAPKVEYVYEDDEEKFVSDIIDNKMVKTWTSDVPVLITCQTGKGKTHFIKEAIMPKAYNESTTVLILVNRTALARQIKRDIAKELALTYGDTGPEKNMALLNDEGIDKMERFGFVTILTYQSIMEINQDELRFNKYGYVIADEAHFFTADSTFNPDTSRILSRVMYSFEKSVRIYMTATPEVFFEPMFRAEASGIQELVPKIYDTGRNYNYIDGLFLLPSVSDSKKKTLLCSLVQSVPESEKVLIFVSSKKLGQDLVKEFKGNGFESAFICSETKDSEPFNRLVNKETFTERVLISTSVADNGVNIKDKAVRHVVIDSYDRTSFLQMLGRVRVGSEQTIKLYFFDHNAEYLESLISDAQWQLAHRILLTARKSQGEILDGELFTKEMPGFSVDKPEIYFSELSLYALLYRISKLRRILRLHYKNSNYFPKVTERAESIFADTRKYCSEYPSLSLRLLDALTTQRSHEFDCRQAKRDGRECRKFVNENDYEFFVTRKRLEIMHNLIKSEGLSADYIEKIKYAEYILPMLKDLPDEATVEAIPPAVGYIAAEYANFLGVSPDGIKPYNGGASIDMPSEPVEASGNEDNKRDDIISLIEPLVVSKSQYGLHIKDGKYSSASWPWVEQHGFPSTLSKIDEKHPFGRLIERLIRRYTVTTKAIIGKFNEDPEFKRWIMVKAECSAKGAKHPVHYVMIER